MIEVNLIPDVKREFLKSQRIRNVVVSFSILAMFVAGGILVALGVGLAAIGGLEMLADNNIKSNYQELSSQSDLDDIVTIQNQLTQVSELDKNRGMNSRVFDVISAVNPAAPNNITMSNVRLDPETTTISIDGEAANSFTATDIMKKTILNTKIQYNDGSSTQEVPLATDVIVSNTSFSEETNGTSSLHFTLSFVYPAELTSNAYKTVTIVTPTESIDVTDSKTHVPEDLFAESSSTNNSEEDN